MSKPTAREREAFAQLDALYAELPPLNCRGVCGYACGPIVVTELEARRLQLATHTKPRTVTDTAGYEGSDFDARQRCIYLSPAGRCTTYAIRPLICRAWGLVRSLSCPHGCVPAQWLDDVAFVALAKRVEAIAGRLLQTSAEGLTYTPGHDFTHMPAPRRSPEAIDANANRTRSLRALHGGYILAAVDETKL